VTLKDVMVGEVWLAGGQSNMAWTMKTLAGPNLDSAKAANFPDLRYMNMQAGGRWTAVTESTVLDMSGTAYYFSKEIHRKLGVPVGVLISAVGGTDVERWMDDASIAADADLAKDTGCGDLYLKYITPLLGYSLRGAVWYQGENNARDTSTPHPAWVVDKYRSHFTALIGGWRKQWKADFPFYYVQLPNINGLQTGAGENGLWPRLREAQRLSLTTPNTAMAVTIDVGEANELHPPDKWDVGHRLALIARARQYGETGLGYQSPMYESMRIDGKAIRLFFRHAEGLSTKAGGKPTGFAIAGADGKWVWADAAAISKDTVIVSAAAVAAPTQVRYGWGQNPPVSLYNQDGLPASPFQTNGPQLPVALRRAPARSPGNLHATRGGRVDANGRSAGSVPRLLFPAGSAR
jgi:sialate O-acetylesterase